MKGFWRWLIDGLLDHLNEIKEFFFICLGLFLLIDAFWLSVVINPICLLLLIPGSLVLLYGCYLIEKERDKELEIFSIQ